MTEEPPLYWSDQLAFGTTRKFSEEDEYVVAAGISPSGLVHTGNFREIITVDLVAKSFEDRGEKVRFIYSWDDFDRFRKVPGNVPDEWEKHIGLPLSEVPDPEGCHDSYAEHFEKRLENELEDLGIEPEFIRQSEKFRECAYADLIKRAMNSREKIKNILDKYRSEPLEADWWPLRVYCDECGRDFTEVTDYDGNYTVSYRCNECEEQFETDFSENGNVKPPWRVDWPMRWKAEGVSFEPAGKEHSASGGSRDTANEIVREVFEEEPPVHQMYEFVTRDGAKISSSSEDEVFTISQLKEIYSPEMIRFLFANTKPRKSFEIPFSSEEVFQRYDKFDMIERVYYGEEELENDRKRKHFERVYEMSNVGETPEEKPIRVPFQHASFVAQTVPEEEWESKGIKTLQRTGHVPEDINKAHLGMVLERLESARNWARDYAPEEYRYEIQYTPSEDLRERLSDHQIEALELLREMLVEENFESQDELDSQLYNVRNESELETGEFFTTGYLALLGEEEGPRLSRLILSIGTEETVEIIQQITGE